MSKLNPGQLSARIFLTGPSLHKPPLPKNTGLELKVLCRHSVPCGINLEEEPDKEGHSQEGSHRKGKVKVGGWERPSQPDAIQQLQNSMICSTMVACETRKLQAAALHPSGEAVMTPPFSKLKLPPITTQLRPKAHQGNHPLGWIQERHSVWKMKACII